MTKMKSLIFGVIIMESTINNWGLVEMWNEDRTKNNEITLEEWEPEPIIVEFEPDPELGLDLEDGEVIEFELEPLKN